MMMMSAGRNFVPVATDDRRRRGAGDGAHDGVEAGQDVVLQGLELRPARLGLRQALEEGGERRLVGDQLLDLVAHLDVLLLGRDRVGAAHANDVGHRGLSPSAPLSEER
jgi:hypothetical protein